MKFKISKEDFIEGLQQVQHVVSNRTTLPILSNVLLEADGDSLKLTTTDLDVGVSGSVKATVSKAGSTLFQLEDWQVLLGNFPRMKLV